MRQGFFMLKLHDKEFRPYINEKDIREKLKSIALEIDKDYPDSIPIFISILNGAYIFTGDLLRTLEIEAEISFIKVRSYDGMNSSGKVTELIGFEQDLKGRDVIIIDDIVDSGLTMQDIIGKVSEMNPNSIKVCTMLFKKDAFKGNFKIDYYGFEIENKFVVGYGLDYNGLGRNYNDIYILNEAN